MGWIGETKRPKVKRKAKRIRRRRENFNQVDMMASKEL
jgi:hypothetical protein